MPTFLTRFLLFTAWLALASCSWSATDPGLFLRTSVSVSDSLLAWNDTVVVTIVAENAGTDSLDVFFRCPIYMIFKDDNSYQPPSTICPAFPGSAQRLPPGARAVTELGFPYGYLRAGEYELRATARSRGYHIDEPARLFVAARVP